MRWIIPEELDAEGKQLRVVKLTDYTVPRSRERERAVADRVRVVGDKALCAAEKVRTPCASPDELRTAANRLQTLLYAD